MKSPTPLLLFTILILAISTAVFYHWYDVTAHKLEVQTICDQSRAVNDGGMESLCGEAQDRYNMEYLCADRNPGADCWTEAKS